MTSQRGLLIVIEGLDRTGKSTQVQLLYQHFLNLNRKVEILKFPDRSTNIGKLINSYLSNKETKLNDESIHLLFSANRWELKDYMTSQLNHGVNLILDRYIYSGISYSMAKGLDFDWCLNCDKNLIKPDFIFFLNFNNKNYFNEIQKRDDYGLEKYELLEFQQKVYDIFNQVIFTDSDSGRLVKKHEFIKIDIENKNISQVENEIKSAMDHLLENPIEELHHI
ncbi:bifunctional thymidylate/uridylate kinase [Ascoidea rubescens DSM 1968]|uniref:Thymidylate kinase n=1 Tax=Ascoidea rubescens DSM 1968 TaxID=1344418 RepID=A0A1D2VEJ9_9ASCO|nr:thymidylate kinase [Ascoidea rubescens DSM 1968]ODV60045.1 thymidylate kinase [Ascoidea rubescens DSM 1968]